MKKTQLVGIVNCTPDSYYEKSRVGNIEEGIDYALRLFEEGADIVDIGGESTRPKGSSLVSIDEEIARTIPVIKGVRSQTSLPISIDTYKPEVAEKALEAGADFLNDITGFSDPKMRRLARDSGAKVCVMHMACPPHSSSTPVYPKGVIVAIMDFFKERIETLIKDGVDPAQIILDPGIGAGSFGKTPNQNLLILKHLKTFRSLGFPLYIGLSRKTFIQKILNRTASEILSTTLALNTMCLLEGVDYIRVHDVRPHREIMITLEKLFDPQLVDSCDTI